MVTIGLAQMQELQKKFEEEQRERRRINQEFRLKVIELDILATTAVGILLGLEVFRSPLSVPLLTVQGISRVTSTALLAGAAVFFLISALWLTDSFVCTIIEANNKSAQKARAPRDLEAAKMLRIGLLCFFAAVLIALAGRVFTGI